MAKNIEMNYKTENGSYEVLYPETGNWSKEQILSSDTASNLGIGSNGTPDQAFQSLKNIQANYLKFERGTYIGTGNYSSAHPSSISTSGEPVLLFISGYVGGQPNNLSYLIAQKNTSYGICVLTETNPRDMIDQLNNQVKLEWYVNKVEWYSDSAVKQMNYYGVTYYYTVFTI